MTSPSPLEDAFAHHTWATLRLIDACVPLSIEQLQAPVPGAYGPILDTLRHFIGNEAFDLAVVQGSPSPLIESEMMELPELRALAAQSGEQWLSVLRQPLEPAAMFLEVDPGDGFRREATFGVRLAQALHHANEHRTQICSGLSMLGLAAPHLGAFSYGKTTGETTEVFPGR